ncbi:hypothetical protein WA026_012032 [Henosepilachna vigintioctopunctata]|uniref:MIR domain-containing protein n=1 Tax=Henosepilachna vigintioctopunctata TaxID=420089 RepID=A0AAW1V7L7_9CUCU
MIEPESTKNRDERELMFSVRVPYSLPCKMGNWNEALFLKEEKVVYETYKKDRCQLLLQKTRRMFRNLMKSTRLSHSLEMIKYGENYQIMAPDIVCFESKSKFRPIYLAGLITEKEIDSSQKLSHGCQIVGCVNGTACVRNTFRIVGCDRNKSGEPVHYGDDFYLQIVEDDGERPLYIQCENTFNQMGYHLTPYLSECTGTYCRFKLLHFDPLLRFDHEGSFVRANDRVVIQHVPTGRNLAVESSMVPTFFGSEYKISCHTFRDTHKMETNENIWKIVGEDLPDINAMVRAAKGEEVPDEWIR